MAEHDVQLELWYDGGWNPAPVYNVRDRIKYMRGSKSVGNDTDPANGAATLDNGSGLYAPRSVVSGLYGKIGQNTKVRLRADDIPLQADEFDRSVINGWGLAPTGGGWTTAWTSGGPSNFSASGGVGLMAVPSVGTYSLALLGDVRTDAPDVYLTGVTLPLATGGDLETGPLLAGVGLNTYYMLRAVVHTSNAIDLKIINVVSGAETTLATVSSVLTHAAATPLNFRGQMAAGVVRFKAWQGGLVDEPPTWQATAPATVVRRGWVGVRSGRGGGNTNTGTQFSYGAFTVAAGGVRLSGEVASWKPQRPIKGRGSTPIELAGVLRRIGRGTDPIQSAVTRSVLALSPVAYWPLEGSPGALTEGTAALTVTPGRTITWDDSEVLAGSLPLPRVANLDESGPIQPFWPFPGPLYGTVPARPATAFTVSAWLIQQPNTIDDISASLLQVGPTPIGEIPHAWDVITTSAPGSGIVAATAHLGNTQLAIRNQEFMDGQPHHFALFATQSGPDVIGGLYIDGVFAGQAVVNGRTLVWPQWLYVGEENEPSSIGATNQWVGHVALWDRVLSGTEVASLAAAGNGYAGETAAARFARFCAEEGVPATVIGDPAESVAMGPQLPAPRLDIFDEIARTDDARIFETRADVGLTMRTGASLLNQTAALTISYVGQIKPGLVPEFGDAGIRNDVTATNPDNTKRRVQQLTGPHNVQLPEDDPQGVGRYQTNLAVNTAMAGALSDAAGWRVNLGTFDGTWYAKVTADLDAAPQLIRAVNQLDIGDVLAISELPVDEALDTVEGLIIGIEEDLPPKRRLVTFYLVPYAPYRVGILANPTGDTDPVVGRAETDGSTVVAAIDPGQFFADGFESGIALWAGQSGWTRAADNAHVRTGAIAAKLTPPGAVASGGIIYNGRVPVTAGRAYVVEAWFWSAAGWSDARACVDWRDAADGVLTSALGSATVVPAATWTLSRQVFTAPAGAASAQPRARQGGTPAVTDVLWVDDFAFGPQVAAATPSGPLWTTDPDDFPLDLVVGGQVVTVATITGSSSPQTLILAAPPAYPVPAGADIIVAQPIILAQ